MRAGYDVVALDAYGDLDQPSACHTLPPGEPWRAARAVSHARTIQADAVVYLSNIDNDPRAVAALAAGRRAGETPQRRCNAHGILLSCATPFAPPACTRGDVTVGGECSPDGDWLVRAPAFGRRGAGPRSRGPEVPRSHYAQTFIEGTSGSVVFVAAGGQAVVLGTTRQLVGDAAFGASGFRYCGSLLCRPADPSMRAQADAIARVAAEALGLVGVGGVDYIDDGRVIDPIEVNPRWTASMELVERAHGVSVFAAHVAACSIGALPGGPMRPPAPCTGRRSSLHGTASRSAIPAHGSDDPMLRDITRPGAVVRTSQPVCTVLAQAADPAACYQALVSRAEAVYAQLAQWAKAAA